MDRENKSNIFFAFYELLNLFDENSTKKVIFHASNGIIQQINAKTINFQPLKKSAIADFF
jgi:hypothetical protein